MAAKKIILKHTFCDSESEILCIRFNWDDKMIAAGTSEGNLIIFSIDKGQTMHKIVAPENSSPITVLRWRPRQYASKSKDILISASSDGSITHWHANSGKYLTKIVEVDNQVLALDYNVYGDIFATGGKDFKIRLYDEPTKSLITEYAPASWSSPGHSNRIFSLKFNPLNPNMLISGGWDGSLLVWDTREHKSVGSIFGPNLSGDSVDLKGEEILAGSHRNREYLEIWDLRSLKKIRDFEWEKDKNLEGVYVYAAQFGKTSKMNNMIIAGCSGINETKIFDEKGDGIFKIGDFKKGIYSVDASNLGRMFAFAGGDGLGFIYEVK